MDNTVKKKKKKKKKNTPTFYNYQKENYKK
jgi:hypothetical protein